MIISIVDRIFKIIWTVLAFTFTLVTFTSSSLIWTWCKSRGTAKSCKCSDNTMINVDVQCQLNTTKELRSIVPFENEVHYL